MKKRILNEWVGSVILFLLILFLISPPFSFARSLIAKCNDVATRGYINVLTINLLFSEMEDRESRLEEIADFLRDEAKAGNPIDVVLLQEVVGGALAETSNSSMDLNKLLAARGLSYNLNYQLANGLPGLLSVGNAILSRCEILIKTFMTLPIITEEVLGDIEVPLRRGVAMSRISVPGFGPIHIYSTHLCSYCDVDERFTQAKALLKFINSMEALIPGKNPIILGGDFNTDLNQSPNDPVYQLITKDNCFTDTYSSINMCSSCCDESSNEGCTYGVDGNPYAYNFFTGEQENASRIDYIFIKGKNVLAVDSDVVFKSSSWVSDHSGVLTRVLLMW